FRLFPDTGSGHVLALSRLMWRVVHVDGDRVTLWAAGAYRNSVFHSHLHSDPGSVNGTALPLYRYSDLRNNVLGDWVGLVSLLPISQHVLAQGTDTFGANPNDPLWIPSFSGEANLGAAWGMTEQLRSFDRNGFSINAWSRQRGQNTFSLMNVFTFEGEAWTRTGTFESSVRPALHLSLGALIG
ncbi:MAG: hypothetical protein FWE38_02345, partial [Firmicutes bacterium]|nr:hypothetical protein [Bacillota bacterium]